MLWVPLAIVLSISVLAELASRADNNVINWIARVAPPSLLLLYTFVPFDLITIFQWLIAWAIAGISALLIVIRTATHLIQNARGTRPSVARFLTSTISPAIAISAVYASWVLVSMSVASANRHALNLAVEMKDLSERTGQCSESIPGWTPAGHLGHDVVTTMHGDFGT